MRKIIHILILLLTSISLIAQIPLSKENIPPDGITKSCKPQEYTNSTYPGFEENKGQFVNDKGEAVPDVFFKTSFNGTDMYITKSGVSYVFLKSDNKNDTAVQYKRVPGKIKWYRMDMDISGAEIKRENIIKEYPVDESEKNYYLANCPDGIFHVKTYSKITIKSIYPGIDWTLYFDEKSGLKYDFIIHPGANPANIRLNWKGATEIKELNEGRELLIKTPFGSIKEGGLLCYESDTKKKVNSKYVINNNNEIQFEFGKYNPQRTLIIDPPLKLVWATYYGESGTDRGFSVDIDASGNVFVVGYTASSSFPTLNSGGGSYYQGTYATNDDAFILKFNNFGIRLWATYYGGSDEDEGFGITVDGNDNVYVTGYTNSSDFPIQNLSGAFNDASLNYFDIFILKFNNSGVRQWATYYGGLSAEEGRSITTDKSDNVYVTGRTDSYDFPVQNPSGTSYSAGGMGDVFVLKFNSSGARQYAFTYGGGGIDGGHSIITDEADNILITGHTGSSDFSTYNPGGGVYYQGAHGGGSLYIDAFILKFGPDGKRQWATFYGGSGEDAGYSIYVDHSNHIYVTGTTKSANFPAKPFMGIFLEISPNLGKEENDELSECLEP